MLKMLKELWTWAFESLKVFDEPHLQRVCVDCKHVIPAAEKLDAFKYKCGMWDKTDKITGEKRSVSCMDARAMAPPEYDNPLCGPRGFNFEPKEPNNG